MKKLKKVKKLLKSHGLWVGYKQKFVHRQTRFMFSKLALIYQENITPEDLFLLEKAALTAPTTKKELMFADVSKLMSDLIESKAKWNELGKFLFYVYQTSTYYQDKKHGKDNIFINNSVKGNSAKRDHYHHWIKSLDQKDKTYNDKIVKALKVVW